VPQHLFTQDYILTNSFIYLLLDGTTASRVRCLLSGVRFLVFSALEQIFLFFISCWHCGTSDSKFPLRFLLPTHPFCLHFLVSGQLGARHFLFVHVDMSVGASLVPPLFPSCRRFFDLYHHEYMFVVPPFSRPRPVYQHHSFIFFFLPNCLLLSPSNIHRF